jgi:hypothetical protein
LRASPAIAGREHLGAVFFDSYWRYFRCYFAANTDRLRYEGGNECQTNYARHNLERRHFCCSPMTA